MAQGEAAAGTDLRFIAGRQFNGKAGGDKRGHVGLEGDGGGSVEIHACVFGGPVGVDRQLGFGREPFHGNLHGVRL